MPYAPDAFAQQKRKTASSTAAVSGSQNAVNVMPLPSRNPRTPVFEPEADPASIESFQLSNRNGNLPRGAALPSAKMVASSPNEIVRNAVGSQIYDAAQSYVPPAKTVTPAAAPTSPDISQGLTTGFEAGKGNPIYMQRGQSGERSFSDQGGAGAKAYVPGSISAGRAQQTIGDGLSADPRERAVQQQLGVQPNMNTGGGGSGMLSVMPSRSVKDYQGDLAAMQSLTATRAEAANLRDGITQPMGGSSGMSPAQRAAEKAYDIADLEIGSGTAYGSLGYSPSNRGSQQRAATRRLAAGQKLATDLASMEKNQTQNRLAAAKQGVEGKLMAEQTTAQSLKNAQEQKQGAILDQLGTVKDSTQRRSLVDQALVGAGKDPDAGRFAIVDEANPDGLGGTMKRAIDTRTGQLVGGQDKASAAQSDARKAIESGRISKADANARLQAAGYQTIP